MTSDTHAAKERAFGDAVRNERKTQHLRRMLRTRKAVTGGAIMHRLIHHYKRSEAMSKRYIRLVREMLPKWY